MADEITIKHGSSVYRVVVDGDDIIAVANMPWGESRQPLARLISEMAEWDRYLQRTAAQAKAGNAIRAGKLVRQNCEQCGADNWLGQPVQAHHEDYTKPLEVRWMCRKCHLGLHARYRREGIEVKYAPFEPAWDDGDIRQSATA